MNNTIELQIKTSTDGSIEKIKILNNGVKNFKGTIDQTTSSINKLGKAFSLAGTIAVVKRMASTFGKAMETVIDRTEELNLFNVVFKNMEKNGKTTFSTLGKEATKFQNKLNQAFGANMTNTLRYQALFQSMGENAGIKNNYASIMSETLTKFSYDLASLYNKQESDVAEALRAGVYAGQTKPLRAYGIDVTSTSMKSTLASLGITDKAVSDFNQGEKAILRYISALHQAKVAMGDYANTIESPANQLKVFKNLLVDAKVALSSLFIGTFSKILPYANALLMVIRELSKAIATMFGIKLSDYNSGIANAETGYEDLADSVDDATDSVKELKRQTLGFDQINNLQENKNKNSGSGTSVGGGIDQRLLDAINGYDNGMDRVKMKATDIYEKIMGWLGFTKQINEETGEVSWKLTDNNSTMGKILTSLKDIVKYGKEAVSGVFKIIAKDFANGALGSIISGIFKTIANLFEFIAKHKEVQTIIAKLVEAFLVFKTIKTVLTPVVTLYKSFTNTIKSGATSVQTFGKQLKGTNNYIKDADGNLKQYNEKVKGHNVIIDEATGKTDKWATNLNKAKTAFGGLITAGLGIVTLKSAMEDVAEEGWNLSNAINATVGAMSTIGGFASIGSVFGPIGTGIGVAVGSIVALVEVLTTWTDENDEFAKSVDLLSKNIDDYNASMQQLADSRDKALSATDVEFGYYEQLYEELKNIVDENGKIKSGYEERAQVITSILSDALGIEISIVDGVIQKYSDLETSIYDVINAKKAEATLNAYEAEYNKAMQEKTKRQQEYKEAVEAVSKAQKNQQELIDSLVKQGYSLEQATSFVTKGFYYNALGIKETSTSFYQVDKKAEKYRQTLAKAIETQREASKALDENQLVINNYNKAIELMAGKHYDAVLEMYNNTVTFNGKTKAENDKKYKEEIDIIDRHLADLKTRQSNYSKEEYDALVNGYKMQKEALKQSRDEANKILEEKTKKAKEESIKSVNEQLKALTDRKYEFKKASDGNMQLYIDGIASGKTISESTMTKLVDGTIQKIKDKKMSAEEAGKFLVDGVNLGIGNKQKQQNVYSTIGSFTSNIISWFKNGLGIHSPSKETKQLGSYLIEGLNLGINSEKKNTLNNISNFASDIIDKMDTDLSRFVINFNNQLSNPSLNGNINNKSTISVGDDMANKISSQIAMAINGQTINVQLDAHTDEGVVIDRINQTTKQTGVCPINIPY